MDVGLVVRFRFNVFLDGGVVESSYGSSSNRNWRRILHGIALDTRSIDGLRARAVGNEIATVARIIDG